ncbi:MAG: SAM-dependent methyltransferase [Halobacteriales archaeon SW_9_67_24]|jgi:ubiquinone/menaquinone biosynthesis C-methylase UbiE|nr:MAG: SAM-dependent methyltransferase [Halobacteriales archaeon SW_9_67_24]
MSTREEFDAWAAEGRDRGMEERHWHTAKHVLARMPVEGGDRVLDLGCGSGYAGRALRGTADVRSYGLDGAPEMARSAASYTDDPAVAFLIGDFEHLPFADDSLGHAVSMEAFYYANDPHATLRELRRVLRPGGTFHCAVNYFAESVHTAGWQEKVGIAMTRWDTAEYRDAFREAGFHVAGQDTIPDRETEIPSSEAFPNEGFDTRAAMVDRYRTWGTLLTVGVVP